MLPPRSSNALPTVKIPIVTSNVKLIRSLEFRGRDF